MPTKASTPKKPLTKSTKSKSTKPKSRIAGLSALNKKRKFNWKIAIIIVVVLAVALGYLFVRLSQAGNSLGVMSAAKLTPERGAHRATKVDGTPVIAGAGYASTVISYLQTNGKYYPSGSEIYQFSVTIFDGDYDGPKNGLVGDGGGASISISCSQGGNVVSRTTLTSGPTPHTISTTLSRSYIRERCNDAGSPQLFISVGISPGDYITGISVENITAPPAPAGLPANDASLGAPSTPSPAPAPPASNLPDCANMNNGIGNQNACVSLIQIKLRQLGYTIDVDGIYGKNTSDNIKVFQQKTGLPQDGITGPRTWARLVQANSCSDPAAKQGCTL
jgi:hypothetical protein